MLNGQNTVLTLELPRFLCYKIDGTTQLFQLVIIAQLLFHNKSIGFSKKTNKVVNSNE